MQLGRIDGELTERMMQAELACRANGRNEGCNLVSVVWFVGWVSVALQHLPCYGTSCMSAGFCKRGSMKLLVPCSCAQELKLFIAYQESSVTLLSLDMLLYTIQTIMAGIFPWCAHVDSDFRVARQQWPAAQFA